MTDDIVNHLVVDSTNGLARLNVRHLDCSLAEARPQLIHYFLPPHLTHFSLYLEQFPADRTADSLPDLGSALQALPTSYLQELTIDFDLKVVGRFRDGVSCMSNDVETR